MCVYLLKRLVLRLRAAPTQFLKAAPSLQNKAFLVFFWHVAFVVIKVAPLFHRFIFHINTTIILVNRYNYH